MKPVNQPMIIAQQPMAVRQPYAVIPPYQPNYVIRDPRFNPVVQIPNTRSILAIVPTIKKTIEKPKPKEPTIIKAFNMDDNKKELEVAKYYEPYYKYYDLVFIFLFIELSQKIF